MDISISTYSIDIPTKDISLFKEMIARMGWSFKLKRTDSPATIDKEAESAALDFISSPWPEDGMTADDFVEVCESGRNRNREIVEI